MRAKLQRIVSMILVVAVLIPSGWLLPAVGAADAETVVLEQSFEDGLTGGWYSFNCDETAQTVVSSVYDTQALHLKDRDSTSCSPAIDLELEEGHTYDIILKVRSASADQGHVTMKTTFADQEDSYVWISSEDWENDPIISADWTTFTIQSYAVPGGATSQTMYIETTETTGDIYVDDVRIVDTTDTGPSEIPVVLYHKIVETPSNEWTDTSIEDFQKHMAYLDEHGYTTLTADQYVQILEGEVDAPENPILLTFDDATPDFITEVIPVLNEYSMNAVLFVVSDWIGGDYSMTEAQLQEVAELSNISIENHSKTHDKEMWEDVNMSKADAVAEITAANAYIHGITGKDPSLLAYPYGAYNANAIAAAEENGIKYAFKVGYPNGEGNYEMARYYVRDTSLSQFAALIGGPEVPVDGTWEQVALYDFEDDSTGWGPHGESTVSMSDDAYEGAQALLVSERTADWHGANLGGLKSGSKHRITAYVKLAAGEAASTIKVTENNDSYTTVVGATAITDAEWVKLESEYNATASQIYFEVAEPTASFLIDSVKLEQYVASTHDPADPYRYDFDDESAQGWGVRGDGELSFVTDDVKSEPYALQHSGRTDTWNGPSLDVLDIMQIQDGTYSIKGFARLPDKTGEASTVKLSLEYKVAGADTKWHTISQAEVSDSDWFELSGEYVLPEDMEALTLYIESSDVNDVIVIDDFEIKLAKAPQIDDLYDYETGLQGWVARSGVETLQLTAEANQTEGGTQGLAVTVPEQYNAALLDITGQMYKHHEYELSVWVKMAPGEEASRLRISIENDDTYPNVSDTLTINDEEWVQLTGTFQLRNTPASLLTYVEIADSYGEDRTFYMDDFSIKYVGPLEGPLPVQTDLAPIRDVYQDYFLIGNIVSARDFDGDRLTLLKHHHNVVTAENAMKPDYAYDADREFDLADENALVDQALAEGLPMHGHVLVWHQQMPTWLSTAEDGSPLAEEEALANLRTHITTVMESYGDKVISWDVVNEAMSDNPPNPTDWKASLRTSPWKSALGDDYVEQSFRIAREVLDAHPEWKDIKLYYNDYNDDNQNKAEAIYQMVKEINESYAEEHPGELLIDGIGMQAHYNLNTKPENVKSSLEKFTSLGVEVSVTELDITAGGNNEISEQEAIRQGYLYAQLFKLYKEHADTHGNLARVTFWGLDDSTSWRSETPPLLFDSQLQAKPAYYAVIDPDKFLAENEPEEIEAKHATAVFGTPTIDGVIDGVWSKTPALPIDSYQLAWQGASGTAKVLWDAQNLYVLMQVNDAQLDKSSVNAHEQDSVEVFLDENNAKLFSYDEDDGQYRVNFDNETSFNPPSLADGFESATVVSGTNYVVEMKLPFKTITPSNNMQIGFDAQINDAKDGGRQSVATWNDTTGQGYQDPSVFGVLTLSEKPPRRGGGGGGPGGAPGGVTVDADGNATAEVDEADFQEALDQAQGSRLKINIAGTEDAATVSVKLPLDSLQSAAESGIQRVEVDTGIAAVELPLSLFTGLSDASQVELNVSKVDPADLPEEVREKVGDNPVFDFTLQAGEQVISEFAPNQKVRVSYPYELQEGEKPGRVVVYYIAEDGRLEVIKNGHYNPATGQVHFKTQHFSQYTALHVEASFDDLAQAAWAQDSIEALAAREIVHGVTSDSFMPGKEMTRAQYVQMLVQAFDLAAEGADASFSDVDEEAWYYESIAIAHELGVVYGKDDGSFGVHDSISRQDMAVMTFRVIEALELSLPSVNEAVDFTDQVSIADYAQAAVTAMQQAAIITGMDDGEFAPKASANRAQAAVILYQLLSEL